MGKENESAASIKARGLKPEDSKLVLDFVENKDEESKPDIDERLVDGLVRAGLVAQGKEGFVLTNEGESVATELLIQRENVGRASNEKIRCTSEINWNVISQVGMPPKALQKNGVQIREFLIKGEYSTYTAHAFPDNSGFCLPDGVMDSPVAWAIVEGF